MKRIISILAISFLAFTYGFLAAKYRIFPYREARFVYLRVHSIFKREPTPQVRSIMKKEETLSIDPSASILHYGSFPSRHEIARTAILNTLIEKFGYHSYLEIGQGHRADNFDLIRSPIKIGVDPNKSLNAAFPITSDEFFAINHDTYDLIFIDGLHLCDQVERDVNNSLKILNENGTIVMHDCNPTDEKSQLVPHVQADWTGDVWKAWVKFRASRPDLKMYVINSDHGCGIIRKGRQDTITLPDKLTYEYLDKNRQRVLNLIEINDFLQDLKNPASESGGMIGEIWGDVRETQYLFP